MDIIELKWNYFNRGKDQESQSKYREKNNLYEEKFPEMWEKLHLQNGEAYPLPRKN